MVDHISRLGQLSGKGLAPYFRGQFAPTGITRSLVNPKTRQPFATIHEATVPQVQLALESAREQHSTWRHNHALRRDALFALANAAHDARHDLTELEMLQTGKSQEDALFEVEDTIECLRHFAGYSDKLAGQAHTGNGLHAYTQKEPYGTVGLITSFNYPLLLTGWKLAPSLAAGNCAIVKPAPQTPLTTLALAGLATDILPAGVLSVLPGGAEIGQAILKGVDKISFTGSTAVGQSIMREAAATLTPITLECGGKNAAIVLADADLDEAARHIASGAFSNAGQNCCAVSRVLVSVEVHDTFLDKLSQHLDTQDWGPLIDQTQYERVLGHIERATESPAFVGPRNNDGQSGYYVPPTVFTQVDDHSPLARQEIFGPVLSILKPFRTIEEAIGRANNSPYGLAAGVFTKDYKRAHSIVPQLKAGVVWVNTYNLMPSFLPFGGVKMSGIGKDLGQAAMNEFTIEKSVMFGLT